MKTLECPDAGLYGRILDGDGAGYAEAVAHLDVCPACAEHVERLLNADPVARLAASAAVSPATLLPAGMMETLIAIGANPAPRAPFDDMANRLTPLDRPGFLGQLGPYHVRKIVGQGGMGIVCLAEDPQLQRQIALKILRPQWAEDPSARQRFLAEARSAARVKSPRIVTIHQIGEAAGTAYIAMELLEGASLGDRLKAGAMPLGESLRIAREIAEGLAAIHAGGLIHRDIKPDNVWLEAPNDRVKLLDFGIARPLDADLFLTRPGALVGSPATMSPEQAAGQPVDARSDLFSLGAVIYQLATGRFPFAGDSMMAVLSALATKTPTPAGKLNPAVPAALDALLARLLARNPADRPASAAEVVEAIGRIEGEPDATRPMPTPPAKNRFGLKIALAAAFAALALLATVFYLPAKDGTIRVEVTDPAIEVTLLKEGNVLLKRADKEEIRIEPVAHSFRVKRGDFEFETDKFLVKQGDAAVVKVEYLDGRIQVKRGETILNDAAPPAPKAVAKVPQKSTAPKQTGSLDPVYLRKLPPPLGKFALRFDAADDYVNLGVLFLNSQPALTMECYVTPEPDNKGTVRQYIGVVGVRAWCILGISGPNHTDRWNMHVRLKLDRPINLNSKPDTVRQRVHVAAVRTPTELKIYLNGRQIAETKWEGELKGAEQETLIGAPNFKGFIDRVRISSVARYDKDFTPEADWEPDAQTMGLYRFEEGQGDVLNDSGPQQRHGKIRLANWVRIDGSTIVK